MAVGFAQKTGRSACEISVYSYQLRSGIAYFFSKFAIFQGLDAQKVGNQAIFQGRHTRRSAPLGWEGSPVHF